MNLRRRGCSLDVCKPTLCGKRGIGKGLEREREEREKEEEEEEHRYFLAMKTCCNRRQGGFPTSARL